MSKDKFEKYKAKIALPVHLRPEKDKERTQFTKDLIKDISPYKHFEFPNTIDQAAEYLKHLDIGI